MAIKIDRSSDEWQGYAKAMIHSTCPPSTVEARMNQAHVTNADSYARSIVNLADAMYFSIRLANLRDEEAAATAADMVERERVARVADLAKRWPTDMAVRWSGPDHQFFGPGELLLVIAPEPDGYELWVKCVDQPDNPNAYHAHPKDLTPVS